MYTKLVRISLRSRMQFRGDFFVGMISVFVLNAFSLATIGIVLSRFRSLAGWTIWEIVFLYSMWVLGHSLFSLLFWHMEDLDYYITEGTFDMFLVRPISPFLQFIGRDINYTGFADLLVGIVGIVIALENLQLHWPPGAFIYLLIVSLAGTLIEFSITLSLACVAFWTGRSASSINTVMQVSFSIQRYPVDMYGHWFQVFVTCLLPVAFINYYPARYLLGKVTPGDPWGWLSYISPLVALVLLYLSSRVWRYAIRQYTSTGS